MAKPLADIDYFTEPCCDYPTEVRLAMDDGNVLTYILLNKTAYQFMKIKQGLDHLQKMTVGYQYMGEHRKSRVHKGKL